MKRVDKKRGSSPNQKRWSLNVKVSDAIQYWFKVQYEHLGEVAAVVEDEDGEEEVIRLPGANLDLNGVRAIQYAQVHKRRWENYRGVIHCSTGWVETTTHEVSETSRKELRGILSYLIESHYQDFARFTLLIEEGGAIRSTKWQGHLVEEEVDALEVDVLSLL